MTSALSSWRGRARFFERVGWGEAAGGAFQLKLDGRDLRTPAHAKFELPNRVLAEFVAQEWDAQVHTIETSTMPLTMMCAETIDATRALHAEETTRRERLVEDLLKYLTTDLVLFENKRDVGLNEAQRKHWGKPLARFLKVYGELDTTCSAHELSRVPRHPRATIDRVASRLMGLNEWQTTAAMHLAKGCKSLVLATNLLDDAADVRETFAAARVEEQHQIEAWGLVEGGHDIDEANLMVQISAAKVLSDASTLSS